MRIIYLTDQIYLHGGAEKILIQKMNYWVEWYDYEVLLITSAQKGKSPFFHLNEKVQCIDLAEDHLAAGSYYHPKNLLKLPAHFLKLKKIIHSFNPNAIFVLSFGFVRYILPFIAGKFPVYNEYHTSYHGLDLGYQKLSPLNKIKRNFTDSLTRLAESMYTKIIFLNEAEFDHFRLKNGVIIPNFFDNIKQPQTFEKKKQVITLGRLSYQKGYDLLIDAWEIVEHERTGWSMEIFGNGEDYEALKNKIAGKNLENSLHLNPATDSINEKLSESGFYVMSSRFETFPMVLLEAMSNGLPTVSFDCPTGPRSILTPDEDSFIVPDGEVQALAEKILFLIGDEKLRMEMGQKALENVKRFNAKSVMEKWNQLVISDQKDNPLMPQRMNQSCRNRAKNVS